MNERLLQMLDEAGNAVLGLTENLTREAFFSTPAARGETMNQLRAMVAAVESIPMAFKQSVAEVDWNAWEDLGHKLWCGNENEESIWFAVETLVPNTLFWLLIHRMVRR